MKTRMDALVKFYAGTGGDDAGRLLRDIHIWSDDRLERTHDYIQWLFPLAEPSGFNFTAPRVADDTRHAFLNRPDLRGNLHTSFVRMLVFYGLKVEGNPMRVVKASSFADRAKVWLHPSNHNHLRITRILKSLRLLGLEEEAQAFFAMLQKIYREEVGSERSRISQETMEYWQEAMK
jgi:Opioid growth factor receptor (OGFr) conserved region